MLDKHDAAMEMLHLFHTSPTKIDKITAHGRFAEFLFFSTNVYVMTAAATYVTYRLEIPDSCIIDARELFYHEDAAKLDELVAKFCRRFSVDTETAEDMISERRQLDSCDSDDQWDVQLFTARAAKALGFRGVRVADEQGSSYMIDMLGREAELFSL
jgi:hypothetical protein